MYIARNPQASCLCTYSINDESGANQSGKGHGNAGRIVNPFQERGKRLSVATCRFRSQSSESREGWVLPKREEHLPKEDDPYSHTYNCAWCNFCCLYYQPSIWGQHSVDARTIAGMSRRTEYAFFYMFCILFSIWYDSYESDLYRGEPFRPSVRAWRISVGLLGLPIFPDE